MLSTPGYALPSASRARRDWRDTCLLSPPGLKLLQINFPRTILGSGIISVTAATKRSHGKHTGRKGVWKWERTRVSGGRRQDHEHCTDEHR